VTDDPPIGSADCAAVIRLPALDNQRWRCRAWRVFHHVPRGGGFRRLIERRRPVVPESEPEADLSIGEQFGSGVDVQRHAARNPEDVGLGSNLAGSPIGDDQR